MRSSTPFFKAFGPLLFGRRPGHKVKEVKAIESLGELYEVFGDLVPEKPTASCDSIRCARWICTKARCWGRWIGSLPGRSRSKPPPAGARRSSPRCRNTFPCASSDSMSPCPAAARAPSHSSPPCSTPGRTPLINCASFTRSAGTSNYTSTRSKWPSPWTCLLASPPT